MTVIALLALLFGSFAGLVIGRWSAVLPMAAAIPAAALLAGPEAGAMGALAAGGLLAGVHLHRVVAEQFVAR
jgi:cation transporter-like permease